MSIARRSRRKNKREFKKLEPFLNSLVKETERIILECGEDPETVAATVENMNRLWRRECARRNARVYVDMYLYDITALNNRLKKGSNGQK